MSGGRERSHVRGELLDALGREVVVEWPDDAVRDPLVGDWSLWQRRGGHRTSTDDLLCAWWAVRTWRAVCGDEVPGCYADIGCGVGSVLLMTAHALRPAWSVGVEAQEQSAFMARRSVEQLGRAGSAIDVRCGDLRECGEAAHGRFDLVTGSPPYFPPGTGVPSPDPQRRACRFEERGGVEEYCEAAAHLMARDGLFALVFASQWHERVMDAAEGAGLEMVSRADVWTRRDHEADFLRVYGFRLADGALGSGKEEVAVRQAGCGVREAIVVRESDGQWSAGWRALRREMSLPGA